MIHLWNYRFRDFDSLLDTINEMVRADGRPGTVGARDEKVIALLRKAKASLRRARVHVEAAAELERTLAMRHVHGTAVVCHLNGGISRSRERLPVVAVTKHHFIVGSEGFEQRFSRKTGWLLHSQRTFLEDLDEVRAEWEWSDRAQARRRGKAGG